MGFVGFICPVCQALLDRQEALAHLPNEHNGVIPAAIVEALWQKEEKARRSDDHISPSMLMGCMREYVIARSYDTWVDPYKSWAALNGTIWHEGFSQYPPPGWLVEREFPRHWLEETGIWKPGMEELDMPQFRYHAGVLEYEIFPGIWISWQIDLLRGDYKEIHDYKTKACPVGYRDRDTGEVRYNLQKRYPIDTSVVVQQSLYSLGVQRLYSLDERPAAFTWQLYQGIQDPTLAWRKEEVPLLAPEELEALIRPNVELFLKSIHAVQQAKSPLPIHEMPLQGRTMYNGKKCTSYCGVNRICDALVAEQAEVAREGKDF